MYTVGLLDHSVKFIKVLHLSQPKSAVSYFRDGLPKKIAYYNLEETKLYTSKADMHQ